jgi:hypothetical protein
MMLHAWTLIKLVDKRNENVKSSICVYFFFFVVKYTQWFIVYSVAETRNYARSVSLKVRTFSWDCVIYLPLQSRKLQPPLQLTRSLSCGQR